METPMTFSQLAQSFLADEDGLTATEYAILFVVLAGLIIAAVGALGGAIDAYIRSGCDDLGGC